MSKQAKNATLDTLQTELQAAGKLTLMVHLTPRGGQNGIGEWKEDAAGKRWLSARVSAPPEDGAANEALVALLSKSLRIAKRCVVITHGHQSRHKTIEIDLS